MADQTIAATGKIVSDVLNFGATAAEDATASQGSYFAAQGDNAEKSAYLTAQQIAEQNAALELVSGSIQQTQQEREVNKTLGAQRAAVASSGFANSGSALALLRSSRQQGYLAEQLTGVQSQITAGGYAGQAAAASSEASAAGSAADAATALAQEQAKQGQLIQSYAAAEADALTKVTGADSSTGPRFNGVSWVNTGTPQQTTAGDIAKTVAGGGQLTPDQLAAEAIGNGTGNDAAASRTGFTLKATRII